MPTGTVPPRITSSSSSTDEGVTRRDGLLGGVFIGFGVLGVAVAVAIGVLGFRLVDRAGHTVATSLSLTADAIATVEDTVDLADETIGSAADGLATLRGAVDGVDGTLDDIATVMRDTAGIVGDDVPRALDAIRTTMPTLIETTELVSTSLGALSFLGVDFAPSAPPGDALREIDRGLADVSAQLGTGSADLERIAADFGVLGADVAEVTADLDSVIAGLDRAADVLDGYGATAAEAAVLVDESIVDLEAQVGEAKLLTVVLAAAIALAQLIPLLLGLRLLRARPV